MHIDQRMSVEDFVRGLREIPREEFTQDSVLRSSSWPTTRPVASPEVRGLPLRP